MGSVRTLIVDDDPLARRRVRGLLEGEAEIEIVGEAASGREAVERIRALGPDLVFLDVQMPEMDGFEVVAEIGAARMPVIVFVSAYVDFALRAFEAHALDYLLKPFEDERFAATLRRAREQVSLRQSGSDPRLGALLDFLQKPAPQRYPEVLAVKGGDQYSLIRAADIDWIEADGNYARLHVGKTPRLITTTLTELENRLLDPTRFVRIHRSTIVNLDRIVSVEPLFHGELSVHLRDGTRLTCSRRFRKHLQDHIYFTS